MNTYHSKMKDLEKLAEKYRLEAEFYHSQLEAKKNSSNAVVTLTGMIIQMTKDLVSYELKTGKNAVTERRRQLIKDLEEISDFLYQQWFQLDSTVYLLEKSIQEKHGMAKRIKALETELENLKQSYNEL